MPRKKSVSGRAKGRSMENMLQLQAQKINKRLRSIEKAGNFGKYKVRELLRFASQNPYVSIKKSRGSKRHKVVVEKVKKSLASQRLIRKKFGEILKSKVFSNIGIKRARKETRASLARTLQGQIGQKVTDEDLDRFYDIVQYAHDVNQESILDKINPSDFNVLVNVAINQNASLSTWISLLNNYVLINNDYMRKEAEDLYYKYVA